MYEHRDPKIDPPKQWDYLMISTPARYAPSVGNPQMFCVQGLGSRLWGLGFRVLGFGFRV